MADPADGHPADIARRRHHVAALHFSAHMHSREFFSHRTAAVLWGLPVPTAGLEDVDVSVIAPARAPRGRGVRGHALASGLVTVTRHPELGVAITSPASTWVQLGSVVRHPYDLTALADAVIRVPRMPGRNGGPLRPAYADLAELDLEMRRGRRIGISLLEDALARAREGASSRTETWTRCTIMDAGLPEPVLDFDVYDAFGRFVGCVDLAYPRVKVAIEYEGDHHRTTKAQWDRDIQKYADLEQLGWRVIRVTGSMLFERPGELVSRVRAALASRA
jgi:very-short-patch-repair endonuclease